MVSTGITFIKRRLRSNQTFRIRRIPNISIRIFLQRYEPTAFYTFVLVRLLTFTLLPSFQQPLAPANGAAADATRDPLLKDKVHGVDILELRKATAFAGFTHKSPRPITYARLDKVLDINLKAGADQPEGPRPTGTLRGRAMSF